MTLLLCGLFVFIATHAIRIVAEPLRQALLMRWGEKAYKSFYSVLSLLGFGMILMGYAQARMESWVIWTPPPFLRHINWLLMLLSLILLVAAYIPHNHLKMKLKHPMVLSVKVWALAHLLVNGQMHQCVLFASLLVWAVLSFKAARQRDALAAETLGAPEIKPAHILSTAITLLLGTALWAALLWYFHAQWFGVSPLGAMAT